MVTRLNSVFMRSGAVLVAVGCFVFVANHYVISPARNTVAADVIEKSVRSLAKHLYTVDAGTVPYWRDQQLTDATSSNGLLHYTQADGWKLTIDGSYQLDLQSNVVVVRNQNDMAVEIELSGVKSYHSVKGETALDIPSHPDGSTYRVYEQEDYLPILGYHYVVSDESVIPEERSSLDIRVSDFEAQIKFLTHEAGCRWYTLGDIVERYILMGKKVPEHACAINFDDGHADGYTLAFPILQKYGAVATFYVITEFVGAEGYLSWAQLKEMYEAGNEVGSHTTIGGSLVRSGWYTERFGTPFTEQSLLHLLEGSKSQLAERGYHVTTFAYPLGEWNDQVVAAVKEGGYLAARDTEQDHTYLDPRASTVGPGLDFLWHMHYIKPERMSPEELAATVAYTRWWQFEDMYKVGFDVDGDVSPLSTIKIDNRTYGILTLPDATDTVSRAFSVRQDGNYTIEVLGSTGEETKGPYSYLHNIRASVDGNEVSLRSGKADSCTVLHGKFYCIYTLNITLNAGQHDLTIESNNGGYVRLDRFSVYREFAIKDEYEIQITSRPQVYTSKKGTATQQTNNLPLVALVLQ